MVWNPNSGTMSRSSWGSGGKTFHPGLPGAKFTLGREWDFVWQCSDLWFFSDQTDIVGPPGALEEATTLHGSDFSSKSAPRSKLSFRDQRGGLGLGHDVHSPPAWLPGAALLGGSWMGEILALHSGNQSPQISHHDLWILWWRL